MNRLAFIWAPATLLVITSVCGVCMGQTTGGGASLTAEHASAIWRFLDNRHGEAVVASAVLDANALLSDNPLGLDVKPIDDALRAHLQVPGGLVITMVNENGEGARAGLRMHDVIVSIRDGDAQVPVQESKPLNEILGKNAGRETQIEIVRAGKRQTVTVTLPKQESSQLLADTPVVQWRVAHAIDNCTACHAGAHATHWKTPRTTTATPRYRIGVSLSPVDETLRSQLHLPSEEGLLVTEVLPGTPAEKAGVKQHDVFVELDGKRLTTVEQLTNQVQEIKDRQVAVKFVRGGKEASVQVAPELDANSAERYWYALNDVHQRRIYDAQAYHRFKVVTSEVADDTQPEAQLSRLKQQLHEIQLTVERLEASLGKAPPSKTP